jgi:hypothetical protein
MFCISITPFDRQGVRRHGLFFADLDGRQLCISRQPVRDVARILLAEGANPDDPIGMFRHHDGDGRFGCGMVIAGRQSAALGGDGCSYHPR